MGRGNKSNTGKTQRTLGSILHFGGYVFEFEIGRLNHFGERIADQCLSRAFTWNNPRSIFPQSVRLAFLRAVVYR